MQTETTHHPEDWLVDRRLDDALRLLGGELKAVRAEAERQRGRVRRMAAALAVLPAAAGWSILPSFPRAEVDRTAQQATPLSPDQRAARRAELLAMLPADKRRELESFEREVDWLSGYMQTWDQGKAGAVVAMMLFKMSKGMDNMPSMEQQMRTMSGQMGALPAIVGELSQINVKMHVITTTMDSTMGRAGRMMPWNAVLTLTAGQVSPCGPAWPVDACLQQGPGRWSATPRHLNPVACPYGFAPRF